MSAALLWLLVPVAPLAAALLLTLRGNAPVRWMGLACVPALALALWPVPPLVLTDLWPGAAWGSPDQLTRGWLAFTALLWAAASVFAAGYVPYGSGAASRDAAADSHGLRFWLCWLLAMTGNLLLVVAQDALSFYVGFTVMSLAAYALVVHYRGPEPRRAGRVYLQLAVCGEMILFGVFAARAFSADGDLDFARWQALPVDAPTLALLLLGFGLKVGFWPLHFWLPLAHPAAPAPASAVLSGAMIEAGVLGLWRCLPDDDPLLQQVAGALLGLGLISALGGVLLGLLCSRAKAALAYSSVSQMGYLLAILALAWRHPGQRSAAALLLVVFAAHHGFVKGALFLATAVHPLRPRLWALLLIPALALCGVPLASGGVAKGELKHLLGASDFAHWSGWFKLGTLATTLLVLRALWLIRGSDRDASGAFHDRAAMVAWASLCIAPLVMPWLWPAYRELLHAGLSWSTSWELVWPMAVAAGLAWLALRLDWRVPGALRRWQTPALRASAGLARMLRHPPLPTQRAEPDRRWWRHQERRWNRFWNARDGIASSTWLLGLMLLFALLW